MSKLAANYLVLILEWSSVTFLQPLIRLEIILLNKIMLNKIMLNRIMLNRMALDILLS